MQIRKAARRVAKMKLGISGPAGSGKTMSGLKLAFGLCGDWEKICVIDSEHGSADLYSDLGNYNVISLKDFSPENYIKAMDLCEKSGIAVIIIDSTSHEWEYCIDYHSSLQGNSFTNWSKVTPRHDSFRNRIMRSPCHIITTTRRKQDYVINSSNGKNTVEKLGTKEVQRDGWEYDLTLNFELNMSHMAIASKDRTQMFSDALPFVITEETGKKIQEWCSSGAAEEENLIEEAIIEINNANSIAELTSIYNSYPSLVMDQDFIKSLTLKKENLQNK